MPEIKREQLLTAVIAGRGPAYLRGVDLSLLDLSKVGWLVEADLRQANLSGANLSRANLKGAKLEKANLHSANLMGANLEGTDLREAQLTAANLKKANLRGTSLQKARLVGANLARAHLEGSNLEGADLEGANLEGADLWNVNLNAANLKTANLRGADIQVVSLQAIRSHDGSQPDEQAMASLGFNGSVNHVQLTDLIQLVCLSRKNLVIRVESAEGQGTIHICAGRVHHARTGDIRGEEAFFEMLQWDNGRFETSPLIEKGTKSIDKTIEHLVIESMRQRDEKQSEARRAI